MIKGLILAIQFLTRLPIKIPIDFNDDNLRKSTFFYPWVGMILGGLSVLPYWLLSKYNINLASFMSVVLMIILTGGLHLDGLSDTADGFFSNKKKEDILEIMKDSRIGAFGVLSLILIVMGKYIVISSFTTNLPLALIMSMGNSRLVVLCQIAFKKMARPGGLGAMLHGSKPKRYIIMGILSYILLLAFLDIRYIIPLLGGLILGEIITIYSYKKIGGFTGDVYGATIELTELISLFIFWGILK